MIWVLALEQIRTLASSSSVFWSAAPIALPTLSHNRYMTMENEKVTYAVPLEGYHEGTVAGHPNAGQVSDYNVLSKMSQFFSIISQSISPLSLLLRMLDKEFSMMPMDSKSSLISQLAMAQQLHIV